jgi:hypothetical protein
MIPCDQVIPPLLSPLEICINIMRALNFSMIEHDFFVHIPESTKI